MLKTLADNRNPTSLAGRMRRRRFRLFEDLLVSLPGEIRVLDVGGTPTLWEVVGFKQAAVG